MPEYAYDPNVFDVGVFDGIDITPLLVKVAVERGFRRIAAGQDVSVAAYIRNVVTTVGRSYPFNPAGGVALTLYGPTGLIVVTASAMQNVSTGIYTYAHATEPTDATGPYTGVISASHGSKTLLSKRLRLFEII